VRTTTEPLGPDERELDRERPLPEDGQVLHPGTLLRERWRILRFLGQGGMGVVYEAADVTTGERVALKVLPARSVHEADALASLRDELLVARRVSHHNVCRVHEVYLDPSPGSHEPGFFTMEFLDGETLAARLKRQGRLDARTALSLVRQLTAGLQAAHDVGVIHRDLKPGNVMLVPEGESTRLVITDFGVAWAAGRSRVMGSGEPNRIVGSPAYMAPEQVEGGKVTPASDIFALGVCLYEMVTGALPFHGDTPEGLARVRRTSPPVPPSRLVPEVSQRWNRTILACLDPQPDRRPPSAEALLRRLERERRPARAGGVAAVLAVLVVLGVWGIERLRPTAAPGGRREVVAVLGFENVGGRADQAWISTGLSELLAIELGASEAVRVVPGQRVERVMAGLGLSGPKRLEGPELRGLTDALGADLVLLGNYLSNGPGGLRVDAQIQDPRSGSRVGMVSVEGREAALPQLAAELGRKARGLMRVKVAGTDAARASRPVSEAAARGYAEAVAKHRAFDEASAKASLLAVLETEPGFVRARALLAEVLEQLGEDERARAEAARAVTDGAGLPESERRGLEALRERLAGNQARAASEYATLLGARPDDIETGLLLASVQPPKEAVQTLEALRRIPGPAGKDLRIDLAAVKAQLESDPEAALSGLEALEPRLASSGQPLLIAQGHVYRGDVFTTLGKLDEAGEALAEAEPLLLRARNLGWAAEVKRMRSDVVALSGRWDEAQRLRAEVLETYEALRAPAKAARASEDLLQSTLVAGRISEAHRWFDRTVSLLNAAGIDPARIGAREASLAMAEADMRHRREALERWIEWAARQGNPAPTNSRQFLAWVLYDEDRLDDALASVTALEPETAKGFAAISLRDLKGSILLEQGHAAEAVTLLNQAFDTPTVARSPMLQLRRGDILGRALAATGAVDAGLETVRGALTQARPPQPVNFSIRLRLREVDLLRLEGQLAEARRKMAGIWADVPPDYTLLRMEARLVRGKLDLASGQVARARADLGGLSAEAARSGFHRLARLAREALAK